MYISHPRNGSVVGRKSLIKGFGKPAQVYVFSNDGRWYLQKPVSYHHGSWHVYAYFGDSTTKSGAGFQIVAVNTTDRPKSPIDALPEACKSNVLSVTVR